MAILHLRLRDRNPLWCQPGHQLFERDNIWLSRLRLLAIPSPFLIVCIPSLRLFGSH